MRFFQFYWIGRRRAAPGWRSLKDYLWWLLFHHLERAMLESATNSDVKFAWSCFFHGDLQCCEGHQFLGRSLDWSSEVRWLEIYLKSMPPPRNAAELQVFLTARASVFRLLNSVVDHVVLYWQQVERFVAEIRAHALRV